MKKPIRFLHNGKELKSLADVLPEAATLAIYMLTERVEEGLRPFVSEIQQEGGQVTVRFKGDEHDKIDCGVDFTNLSPALQQKVHGAVLKALSE